MASFSKAAKVSELPKGTGKTVEVDGKSIALFNCDGKWYAMDNACAHHGGPLGEGMVSGKTVTCPWHGWEYDIPTGQCAMDASVTNQQYEVKIEGDDILIAV